MSQCDRQEYEREKEEEEEGGSNGWPPAPETGSDRQKDEERLLKEEGIWVSLSDWAALSMLPLSDKPHTDLILLYKLSFFFQGILRSPS